MTLFIAAIKSRDKLQHQSECQTVRHRTDVSSILARRTIRQHAVTRFPYSSAEVYAKWVWWIHNCRKICYKLKSLLMTLESFQCSTCTADFVFKSIAKRKSTFLIKSQRSTALETVSKMLWFRFHSSRQNVLSMDFNSSEVHNSMHATCF